MSDQYITLLSSYDSHLYNNKSSSFRNRLSNELVCPPSSEVALIECSFLHDFALSDKEATMSIFDFLYEDPANPGKFGKLTEFTLDNKYINNPLDLALETNSGVWAAVPRLKRQQREIFFYGKNRRIWVSFKPSDYVALVLKSQLLVIMGVLNKDRPQDAIVIGKSKQKDSFVAPDGSKKYFSDPYKDLVFRSVCNTTDYFLHHPKLKNIDQLE